MKGRVYQNQGGVLTDVTPDAVPTLKYELCEVYYFLNPALRPGFVEAAGGLIADAPTRYPMAWAYLQTAEGGALCVNEAQWQAASTATYYTNAAGVSEGWNGVGGVAKFVIDTANGTIRVPDLRGMYMEVAGHDGFVVGAVHCDATRRMTGTLRTADYFVTINTGLGYDGAFYNSLNTTSRRGTVSATENIAVSFDTARVVPAAAQIQPRAFGVLASVYLGA